MEGGRSVDELPQPPTVRSKRCLPSGVPISQALLLTIIPASLADEPDVGGEPS